MTHSLEAPYSLAALREAISNLVDQNQEFLIALSDRIHANPEVGFKEYKAARWITEQFSKLGFKVETGVAGLETAFVARYHGSQQRPNLGFIVEYDALPNLGHACGHNTKGPATLGSIMAILGILHPVPGTITVFGTPAEEGGGGKVIMANAGVFDELDAAIALSVGPRNMTGLSTLVSRTLKITIKGHSAHAHAQPHKGKNALSALIGGFNHTNALRQQFASGARVNGIITEGGSSVGAIPDFARAELLVSAREMVTQAGLEKQIKGAFSYSADVYGCSMTSEPGHLYREMKLNRPLISLIEEKIQELGLELGTPAIGGGTGATDMGNVSHVVPADTIWLSLGREIMPHTEEYRVACSSKEGHTALLNGAKVGALVMLELFLRPSRLTEIKEAFCQLEPNS